MNKSSKSPKMLILDLDELDSRTSDFMDFFRSRMIGQPNAEKMAQMVFERMNNPLRNKRRPIAVIANIGPSRTGKSYFGRLLAEFIHGNPEALTEIECADFTEKHQVLELKGAPPSYVGSLDKKEKDALKPEDVDPRSQITNHNLRRVRLNSTSDVNVVVLNEFEKGHETLYKLFMGGFDKGYVKLGDQEIVDFTNTIFVVTMNLAMDEVEKLEEGGIGFVKNAHKATEDEVSSIVHRAMKRNFKREFRNRIDAVCIFKPHTADELLGIVDTELGLVERRMSSQLERGQMFELEVDASAKQFLLDKALADGGSVAELSRVMDAEIVNKLGRALSTHQLAGGDRIVVFLAKDKSGVEKLAFGLFEGEGALSDADKLVGVVGGTAAGLDWQRQVHRAKRLGHKPGTESTVYSITLHCTGYQEMLQQTLGLKHDLEAVYELELGSMQLFMKPFFATVTVTTTEEMVAAIKAKYPEAEIAQVPRKRNN